MSPKKKLSLIDQIADESIVDYLYLNHTVSQLIEKLHNIKIVKMGMDDEVPFTALNRGYTGARDANGDIWLMKNVVEEEIVATRLQEVAYYIDFQLETLAAPTFLFKYKGKYYRTTKKIQNAMQIGSYNYLQKPFIDILANDLVNRWLFFDEDRNPNNYLVLHNPAGEMFVIVIDYNKADLLSTEMKIEGNGDKFGWIREEKTRFLTLLKPENFDNFIMADFQNRFNNLKSLSRKAIESICLESFGAEINNPQKTARLISKNIQFRAMYLHKYFTDWFGNKKKKKTTAERSDGIGESFARMYRKKV